MDILNIGIVGTGNIARFMANTLKDMDTACAYGVASRELKKAEEFGKNNSIKKVYGSYEELMLDPKVNLIYIATPHSQHYQHMKLCLKYNKAILCEKPFAINREQAKEILEEAYEKKIFVAEGIWTRYMPMVKTIKDIISSGMIGDVQMTSANLGYNIEKNQRLYDPNLAGGALLDLGVYVLNWASIILGTEVEKITSTCTYHQTGVDRNESITLTYKNGTMAVLNVSMGAVGDRRGQIYGTKGYAVIDNINNYEAVTVYNEENKEIFMKKRPEQLTGFEYEINACQHALQNNKIECQEMPHKEILRIMELMDQIRFDWGVNYPCE